MREDEGLSWSDPWLQAIDLEYHNITPELGLFCDLQRQGTMRRVVSDEEVNTAIFTPPETTRAFFRGRAVAKFSHAMESVQWDEIVFVEGKRSRTVRFPELVCDSRLQTLNALVRDETDFGKFFLALSASGMVS
jgi:proteasome accessory factor A